MKNFNEKQNLILQKYLAVASNYAICVDITYLGAQGDLFLAIDLAARTITGHCYSSNNITTEQICETIETIARQRSFLPKIEIIHSDCGAIFAESKFEKCLASLNILESKGLSYKNQNQVVERLNRTLKMIIREEMTGKKWNKEQQDPLETNIYSSEEVSEYVKRAIEIYNDKPHKALFGLSPNHMEEALFEKHGNKKPSDITLITYNNNSALADSLRDYKKQVALKYKGDWEQFFIEWRQTQQEQYQNNQKQLHKVIEEVSKSADEARKRENEISKKYQNLFNTNLEIQKQLEFLHRQALALKEEKEIKEALKLKKQQAKKLTLRDTVSPEDFYFIIKKTNGKSFIKERKILAFVLLYLTGLRVSNLLLLNKRHIIELMSKGGTNISLIKGGAKRFNLALSHKGRKMLLNFKEEYLAICKEKQDNDPVFTTKEKPKEAIRRDNFDKELNLVLKQASTELKKNIRTHSFRATVITELLKETSIDEVKEVIGHRSIVTTLEYKRSRLSPQEIKKIHAKRSIETKYQKKRKKGRKNKN